MARRRYAQFFVETLLLKLTKVVWEAIEYHQAAIANKETYAKIKEALGKAAAKVEFMHDATFSADLSNALTAPVTEIVAVDVHPTTDLQEFNKRRTALVDKIVELSPSIWHGGGCGATHDNSRKLWICFGWDSPEVCCKYYPMWFCLTSA